MGRIRTHFVKSVSEKIGAAYPDRCTGDFEANKKFLGELKLTDEKFTRNKIAGYMVRVSQRKKIVV